MTIKTFSQQVVRSFLWQGGGQLAGQAVSWVATLMVIRLLAPEDYGLLAMASVLMGFFFLVSDLGFGAAAIQADEIEPEELRQLFGIVIAFNTVGFALTLGLAPLAAWYFGEPRLTPIIAVLAVNFLLLGSYVLPQSQMMRTLDFRAKAGIDLFATVLSAAASLGLALVGVGAWALVAGSVTLHLTRAVGYNIVAPIKLTPTFAPSKVMPLMRFGALITVDRLLFFLYGQVDVLIGGRVLGTQVIGQYTVALSLAVIPMEKLLPVLTQVSFSAFSRIQHEPERVRRNVRRAIELMSLVCFPAFFGMAAVAGDLVPVVLGERWMTVIVPFQLLCLVLPLKAVAALLPPALFGTGRPKVNVVNMAITLGLMAPAFMVGVRYGVLGLALAWIGMYPVVFVVTSVRAVRALGMSLLDVIAPAMFPLAASISMAVAVLSLRSALDTLGPSPLRLAALIGAGALVYTAAVTLFRRDTVRELIATVRA